MSNDIEREWDEKETSDLEPYEEGEAENVLRSEKDRVLSRLNRGINYEHLELSNIL
jgi:hypothetical protein